MQFRDQNGKMKSVERSVFTLNTEYYEALAYILTGYRFRKTNCVENDIRNLITDKNVSK